MIGQEKIAKLILDKGQDLILSLVPSITQIADKAGIKNIGQPNEEMPNTCLSSNEIQELSTLRNNLYNKLTTTSKLIENLSRPINTLNTVVTTTTATLTTVSAARKATNIGITFIPSPPGTPGAVISTLNNLKDLEEFLKPKIVTAQILITSISSALDFTNEIINNLLILLKSIDAYLTKCGAESPPSLNSYLLNVEQTYNQITPDTQGLEVYQGFILEVVEESFSPTVNKRKAIAKNNNGVILLQTPSSFTTIPQILIEELKLIIDKSDLKAY